MNHCNITASQQSSQYLFVQLHHVLLNTADFSVDTISHRNYHRFLLYASKYSTVQAKFQVIPTLHFHHNGSRTYFVLYTMFFAT